MATRNLTTRESASWRWRRQLSRRGWRRAGLRAARSCRDRLLVGAIRSVSLGYALPGTVIAVGILLPVRLVRAQRAQAPLAVIVTGSVGGLLYAYLLH